MVHEFEEWLLQLATIPINNKKYYVNGKKDFIFLVRKKIYLIVTKFESYNCDGKNY